jgi:hypothetical protein
MKKQRLLLNARVRSIPLQARQAHPGILERMAWGAADKAALSVVPPDNAEFDLGMCLKASVVTVKTSVRP